MGSTVLGEAIKAVRDWSIKTSSEQVGGAEAAFGSLVFNDTEQKKRLPKQVYTALRRTISHGEPLDAAAADGHLSRDVVHQVGRALARRGAIDGFRLWALGQTHEGAVGVSPAPGGSTGDAESSSADN